jgi:hypothetical protein
MRINNRTKNLQPAFRFFFEHAGYVVGRRAECALSLAKAEEWANRKGIEFVIEPDQDADWSFVDTWSEREQEEFRSREHEVISVLAFKPCRQHGVECKHAICVASLSGIFDADNSYLRVIRAELAAEARQCA